MRYVHLLLIFLLAGSLLIACRDSGDSRSAASSSSEGGSPSGAGSPSDTVKQDNQLIMALLYQQRSAEYRALCLQCYNLARLRVDQLIGDKKNYTKKSFAIVTDLDETALDNSGNEAWLYVNDSAFSSAEFDHWSVAGDPGSVPGAVDFFKYVDRVRDLHKRKLHIYYVSNRTDTSTIVEGARRRMHALGFPQTDDATNFRFQPKGSASSKEPRRQKIGETDTIMLLLGDNLTDLSKVFDGTASDSATRMRRVDSMGAAWGKTFIVLPNAEYGDWEKALYPGGKYMRLGDEQEARKKDLKVSGWQ